MKICLACQRHGQSRDSGFAVAIEAETAQHGIEFSQVVRMEIDGERRRARGWVRAELAMRFNIALGQVNLQFAQLDRRRCDARRWRRSLPSWALRRQEFAGRG